MTAKERLNAVLTRATGYHLAKGAPGEHLAQLQRELEQSRQRVRLLRKKLAKKAHPERPGLPSDYDDEAKSIVRVVRPYTMTSNDKLYGLIQATRYISRNNIPGAIVECGVWRGGSMQAAARTLLDIGDTSRDLYLFDTYEGMSEPGENDVRWDGKPAAELLETEDKSTWVWAIASLDDVKSGFATIPYPPDKVHYVVGKVEETIPEQLPEQIAILRLDTDWYESTKHELDIAYPRLSPGGVLIIDDYGGWAGSRKATNEFIERLDHPLLLNRLSGGRLAVKPFHHVD